MGRNRKRPPNLVRKWRGDRSSWRTSAASAHGPRVLGPLLVPSPRQPGEAFLLQDRGDRRGADRLAVAGQGAADVVDGEVLLAQRDDPIAQPLQLAGRPAVACREAKKSRLG